MANRKRSSRRDRGGMLLAAQQRSTKLAILQPGRREEASPVRVELLVEFVRAMIRERPSQDLLELCLSQARHRTGASQEECDTFRTAIMAEAAQGHWPPGF